MNNKGKKHWKHLRNKKSPSKQDERHVEHMGKRQTSNLGGVFQLHCLNNKLKIIEAPIWSKD
jgi:hypothetical protein